MTTKMIRIASTWLLLVACAAPLYAWDDQGHMAVAYVAYQKLTPATKDRVKALLALNPYAKTKWATALKSVKAKDKDLVTFMIAATWPDKIKSDSAYTADGPSGGDRPPTDGTANNNIGYTDFAQHKYWHFIDEPFSADGTALPTIPTPNAQTRIADFRAMLATPGGDDGVKSYDLCWLLHLVGDVHQPLHATTRVTNKDTAGDNGGNAETVKCSSCTKTVKLHAFWDELIGTSSAPSAAITSAKALAPADATLAAKPSEADWVSESFQAAQDTVYMNPPIGPGHGPFTVPAKYKSAAKSLAKERIALAGERLGNLLNNELK